MVDDLEEALIETDGYREVKRLIAAIIYKRGPSVSMLADWLDKREARSTNGSIGSKISRFERQSRTNSDREAVEIDR